LALIALPARGGSPGGTFILAMVAAIFLGAASATTAIAFMRWWYSEVAVSNLHVILRVETLRTTVARTALNQIEQVMLSESILGKRLGYGTVVVHRLSGPPVVLRRIPHPTDFFQGLQAQLNHSPDQAAILRVG